MDDYKRGPAVIPPLAADDLPRPDCTEPASLAVRAAERLFAARFDRQLVAGVAPDPRSPLAVHVARLASASARRTLATTLRDVILEAHSRRAAVSSRIPLDRSAVMAAAETIDKVRMRLHAPRPVSARGVARLRLLLADGAGPLYRYGRGDLDAELHDVLALL
jgi:hypothetical protein